MPILWIDRFIVTVYSCIVLTASTATCTVAHRYASGPASSGSLHRLTLLDMQLTDQREVRILLQLRCVTAADAQQCPMPRILLNLTRSVGLYAWSESDQSALRREAESALCQFSGGVGGDGRGKNGFSFASLNLCRGPSGLIDTGRRRFLVQPWPKTSVELNLTAEYFTASPGHKRALNRAFSTGGAIVLLSKLASKSGGAVSQQHSLNAGSGIGPGYDPFAGRRCVTRSPPDDQPGNEPQHHNAFHRHRGKRFRRSASAVVDEIVGHHFVEILFVVDSSIVSFHRTILDDFVFGILGIAQGVFRDPQLEESIELSLASVYRLNAEEEAKIMSVETDQVASDVLDSFNEWIAELHRSQFGQSVSWDISVLLTRKFLFSFVEFNGKLIKDPVLGITTYRSLCEMRRNGVVLQEIGLQSGFSLAHELGHTFNMYHDGSPMCMRKLYPHETRGNFVMDSSLHPSTYPWTWSTCSKLHLRKFLRTSQSDCIRQRSRPAILHHQHKSKRSFESRFYPRFTVDEQCRLLFGAEAAQCDTNLRPCGTLWCRVSMSHNTSICWSKKVVWAPGTPCGTDKICLDGECVPAIHGSIDGGWSQWSEWTNCTVDCGGGVRWRRRFCDNPRPRRGGAFCHGPRAIAETCGRGSCTRRTDGSAEASTEITAGAGATARDAQCAEFAFRAARSADSIGGIAGIGEGKGQRLTAVAVHPRLSSESQCRSITCSVQSGIGPRLTRIFTVDRVRDGLPCHPFDYGVCIGGVCMPAGCDGVLNSNLRWDACGVCGGSNDTCHLENSSLTVNNESEMPYVHIFSEGSSSFELTTEGGSGRFCTFEIIKSSNNSSDSWKSVEALYFSGNHVKTNLVEEISKQKPKSPASNTFIEITSDDISEHFDEEYLSSGAWIIISRKQDDWHLRGIGRLTSNLSIRVKLLGTGVLSDVKGTIKLNSKAFLPNLRVRVATVGNCSSRCQGRHKLEHVCEDTSAVDAGEAKRLPLPVCLAASPSIAIPPLPPYKMCNTHCRLEWRIVSGNCSARCGTGTAVDRFDCVLSKNDGSPDVVLPEPIGEKKDETNYCDGRSVRLLQRQCNGDCRPVTWRFGPWSPCSKTCGSGGTRSRLAVCEELQVFGSRQWPDSECKDVPIPSTLTETCENDTAECPNWRISEWSSCDAYCASGTMQRSVYCRWKSEPVPPELCSGEMPIKERNCTGWCFGRWVTESWSKCHMPCQNGRRFRKVSCIIGGRKVNSLNCPQASKPAYLQDCSNQCVHWLYSKWGQCSTTCGSLGSQTRLFLCANASNHLINSSKCFKWIGTPTDTVRPCFIGLPSLPECPGSRPPERRYDWRVTTWSHCSHSCGSSGVRRRQVDCLVLDGSNNTANESDCSILAPKPTIEEACNTQIDCPYWLFQPWSKCLAECGEGIQLRSVSCQQDGRIIDDRKCNRTTRPIDLRPCNSSTLCPGSWTVGEWSECSRSCGKHPGVRLRKVTCQSWSGQPVPDAACSHEQRPINLMECVQLPCPTWVPTEWSSCIGLCGTGTRTRDLHCQWSNGSMTGNDTLCAPAAAEGRPSVRESCQLDGPDCRWSVGPWSRCQLPASTVCSGGRRGHRHRTVECRLGKNGPVLPEALCTQQRLLRPRNRRRCRTSTVDADRDSDSIVACGSIRKRHAGVSISGFVGAAEERRQGWRIGSWSACSANCGRGYQTRRLTPCNATELSAIFGCRRSRRRPRNRRRCFLAFCPHAWTADPWSDCSVSCGRGWITRKVECQRFTPEGWRAGPAADSATACDKRLRPDSRLTCNLGDCPDNESSSRGSTSFWEADDYGECRYSNGGCGEGERRRLVRCRRKPRQQFEESNKRNDGCQKDEKPPDRDACQPRRCRARSCSELKSSTRIKLDGQFRLRIDGRDVRVYCFGMQTRRPREFVTLPATNRNSDQSAGRNFAVMHNIGLTDPSTTACPSAAAMAGFSRAACSQPDAICRVVPDRPGFFVSGMAAFRKYRLLLSPRLQIDATDGTFAISWKTFVPAGRAGDCFSRLPGCSVGSFSIDLTGTDFELDKAANVWQGENTTTVSVNYLDQQTVQGVCGGLCGYCKLRHDRLLLKTSENSANQGEAGESETIKSP